MDEHFYNDEFKEFLQQQVKQHRMYPSDAVWKGIYKQMHGNKRWPGLNFFAILMVAALTVTTLFIERTAIISNEPYIAKAETLMRDHFNPEQLTASTITKLYKKPPTATVNDITPTSTRMIAATAEMQSMPAVATGENEVTAELPALTSLGILPVNDLAVPSLSTATEIPAGTPNITSAENIAITGVDIPLVIEEKTETVLPLPKKNAGKWQLQFYITPSMSYMHLVDEKPESPGPNGVSTRTDVNKLVKYRPGMGTEIGIGALYKVADRLRVKTALQFNIRQYNIDAYAGNMELTRLALVRGGYVDTLNALVRYRSTRENAYGEAELLNKYYQLSLPVGIDYALVDKKLGVNIGVTLQPTYTFTQNSYLLTTDYKSYAEGGSLMRKWNLNSSVEANLTYRSGDIQWKFGPQLRYQHLPTYSDPYPIKEYLVDYGFKIGFTKTIQ